MADTGTKPAALLSPLASRSAAERWLVRLVAALASAGAYLLLIPWDTRNRATAAHPIDETTPVSGLGVVLLAVILLVLGAYVGHRDRLGWAFVLVALPPSALLLVSLSSHPEQDISLWPLAWVFLAAVITGVVAIAALVGRALRRAEEAEEA